MKKVLGFIKKHKKLTVVLIILILIGIGIGVLVHKVKGVAENLTKNITTETVQRQDISNYVAMTGTVIANDSQTVYSTQNGLKVLKINVEVGDEVKEGDVIAVLDSEDYAEKLETAKRQLEVDEAKRDLGLRIASEDLADAKLDGLDNWKEGEISVAQANTDLYYAQIEVQRACEDLSKAQSDLNYAVSHLEQELSDAKHDEKKAKSERDAYTKDTDPWNAADKIYQAAKDKRKDLEEQYENREHTLSNYYSSVNNAQRQVENANENLEKTQRNADNAQEKFADSAEQARRQIVDRSESLEERKLDASIATDSSEDRVKELQKQVDECTIKAPMSGVITSVSIEEGDETSTENNTICVIQDTTGFKAEGTVDEYDISKIYEGMTAVIKTEATGDLEMTGKVSFVSPTPKTQSSSAMNDSSSAAVYPVRVIIDELDEAVRIGMTAETKLIIEEAKDVLTVPYDCIKEKEDGTCVIYAERAEGEAPEGGKFAAGKKPDSKDVDASDVSFASTLGKEIVITKGLETDYYTEISGPEVKEGMNVYVVGDSEEVVNSVMGAFGGGPGGPGGHK